MPTIARHSRYNYYGTCSICAHVWKRLVAVDAWNNPICTDCWFNKSRYDRAVKGRYFAKRY